MEVNPATSGPDGQQANLLLVAPSRGATRRVPPRSDRAPATLAEREVTQSKGLPIKRLGRLRECGLLTAYLASDAASYIIGQTLVIDGGRTIAS